MATTNQFSAVNPALGYLYQVRAALLWSLQKLREDESFQVSVEVLDDVAFESNVGEPSAFLQTKHHANRMAALTDSCSDLWKTLRVWIEGTIAGNIPATAALQLITTGTAPVNSAASKLKSFNRDAIGARALLDVIARTSTSQANDPAYRAYELLSAPQRLALLERVVVIDAAPTIGDIDQELRTVVFWAVDRVNQTPFLDRLEGWWFRRVIDQLIAEPSARIGSIEIESEMSDLRDQFRQDSLPIDGDLLDFELDDATASAHLNYRFVKQLDVIEAGKGLRRAQCRANTEISGNCQEDRRRRSLQRSLPNVFARSGPSLYVIDFQVP